MYLRSNVVAVSSCPSERVSNIGQQAKRTIPFHTMPQSATLYTSRSRELTKPNEGVISGSVCPWPRSCPWPRPKREGGSNSGFLGRIVGMFASEDAPLPPEVEQLALFADAPEVAPQPNTENNVWLRLWRYQGP